MISIRKSQAVLKRAYMLKEILEKYDAIYRRWNSDCPGNQASSNKDAYFPRVYRQWTRSFEKPGGGDVFYITKKPKNGSTSIAPFWENNNLRARAGLYFQRKFGFIWSWLLWHGRKDELWWCSLAINYQKLLAYGWRSFEEKARAAKEALVWPIRLVMTNTATMIPFHR